MRARYRLALLVLVALVLPQRPAEGSAALDAAKICRKSVTAKGKAYANTRRRLLLACVTKALKCELKFEVEGSNPNSCRNAALDSCTAKLNTTGKGLLNAQVKFVEKTALACAPETIAGMLSTAAGGLWFANDGTCGASADIPTLLTCLRDRIDEQVDANVGRVAPRAGLLLDNLGLGGNFPILPRPNSTSLLVSATAPANGTLVDPGVIALPAGNTLKVTGDDTTLPCGMNANNGKVTVTIGTGTSCANIVAEQELTLNETYGAGQAVYFGPFNDDRVYCIDLKDGGGMGGGCNDDIFGSIDVDVPSAAPAATSASLIACHTRLQGKMKALSSFIANKLHGCAEKVVKCKLSSEIDAVDPTSCLAAATAACANVPTTIEAKLLKFRDNIALSSKCPLIAINDLKVFSGGLGFGNVLAGCDGAASLTDLAECILGVADGAAGAKCDVEGKTFIRDPRSLDSLTAAAIAPGTNFPCLAP